MLGYRRLRENNRLFRVESYRQQLRNRGQGALFKYFRFISDGDGVHIGHEIEAFVSLLQAHPMPDRTQVVPQVERICGGLNSGQCTRFFLRWRYLRHEFILSSLGARPR